MENFLITCDFELRSSHSINEVNFSGHNIYNLDGGVKSACPLGRPNTDIVIESLGSPTFKVKITTSDLLDLETQTKYLQELASYLSFVVAKSKPDGWYGMSYVHINYETFAAKRIDIKHNSTLDITDSVSIVGKRNVHINYETFAAKRIDIKHNSTLDITDSVSIVGKRNVQFNKKNILNINHHEILNYYYNGLKAESEKSKFFNWFLIVEYLEGSTAYRKMFPNGTMFSTKDKKAIETLANTFKGKKKEILLSTLNRTSQSRNDKLLEFIKHLGIEMLTNIDGKKFDTLEVIQSVTSARNKLVHRGSKVPESILWFRLFPLVTKIVEKTIQDKGCLEK